MLFPDTQPAINRKLGMFRGFLSLCGNLSKYEILEAIMVPYKNSQKFSKPRLCGEKGNY